MPRVSYYDKSTDQFFGSAQRYKEYTPDVQMKFTPISIDKSPKRDYLDFS